MANSQHLEMVLSGVQKWNKWRKENPRLIPDLSEAQLVGADLHNANLREAHLDGSDLTKADLRFATLDLASLHKAELVNSDLSRATLFGAKLSDANFGDANLSHAILERARLHSVNLNHAKLRGSILRESSLRFANLDEADLMYANLNFADLRSTSMRKADLRSVKMIGANLTGAVLEDAVVEGAKTGETVFGRNDLRKVKGLNSVEPTGPSIVGVETLVLSRGEIPEVFLRGCGLGDWEIESVKLHRSELSNEEINTILYDIHAIRATQAIQVAPLFISYSHEDGCFVDELEVYLNNSGVRFWRDIHNTTSGRLEKQIDRAIRLNPTVLLILSERSVTSDWVEHEVRIARRLEQETSRDVLCPLALDASWETCRWPERLREQITEYQILDFSSWQDESQFRRLFARLIEGLDLFYK